MKRIALLVFALFAAFVVYAQCDIESYIVDPDGYVNVRSDANSKSNIVTRLVSGTIIYVELSNDDSKWHKVSKTKGGTPIGYIHTDNFAWDYSISAYIEDTDGEFTNIRNAPSGKIILRLPTNRVYLVTLIDFQKGWWRISQLVHINKNDEEVPYDIPANVEYWIHTSCVNSGIKGDGTLSFTLLSEPKEGSSPVKKYPAGIQPSIHKILDVSPSKYYLKVKLDDGNVGWIPANIVCYSYFSVCT